MAAYSGYIAGKIQGKRIALLGFYDWREVECMRTWKRNWENTGANLGCDYSISQEAHRQRQKLLVWEWVKN